MRWLAKAVAWGAVVLGALPSAQAVSTIAISAWASNIAKIDLEGASGDVTLSFTSPQTGTEWELWIYQGSTTRNVVWPAAVMWPGGTAPTITAADNSLDIITLRYDGTSYRGMFWQDQQ